MSEYPTFARVLGVEAEINSCEALVTDNGPRCGRTPEWKFISNSLPRYACSREHALDYSLTLARLGHTMLTVAAFVVD